MLKIFNVAYELKTARSAKKH